MKGRAGLFLVMVAMLVVAVAPGSAQAAGGFCGAVPTYVGANSEIRCGPLGIMSAIFAFSSDSAGNDTFSNVCVRAEWPGTFAQRTGWTCGNQAASIPSPDTNLPWVGGYLNNYGGAHYMKIQYYYN
jgi:hypothetical protein